MKKLIVFDVDGTFLDSHGWFCGLIAEYSAANNMPHPCIETIQKGYGAPHAHDFKWGVPPHEQIRHLEAVWRMEDERSAHAAPALFEGAEETMRALKALGHDLAIVTARSEKSLLGYLGRHGIADIFSAARCGCDKKRRGELMKPAPDMLQSVMRELSFTPEKTVMIGDTTMDMQMARAAGAFALGVAWGAHPRDALIGSGAHDVVEDRFHNLPPAIRRLFA